MILTKDNNTQLREFNKKFSKKKNYIIMCNSMGEIIWIDTEDKEILDYSKKLGLK